MKHACNKCQYYYETMGVKSKVVYSGLMDDYVNVSVEKTYPCCGVSPTGAVLDEEQPICASFSKPS